MHETLSTTEDGRSALRMERRLPHPPEEVWPAVSDRDLLSRWYPFRAVELQPRVGGRILFDDGRGTTMDAVVVAYEPPRLFAFSEVAPEGMPRESEDLVRIALHHDVDGCLLTFDHTFDDRPAAASYASGWQVCLEALELVVAGKPVEISPPSADLHDRYVEEFGLGAGAVEETEDGWRVRFERQLTRPVEVVWDLLSSSGPAEPRPGGPAPSAFASSRIPAGAITEVRPPDLLAYHWHADDGTGRGGEVRWELSPGTGHGARLLLTQTGPNELADARPTALAVWRTRIDLLAEQLREGAP